LKNVKLNSYNIDCNKIAKRENKVYEINKLMVKKYEEDLKIKQRQKKLKEIEYDKLKEETKKNNDSNNDPSVSKKQV
jgi:hypothetical protein